MKTTGNKLVEALHKRGSLDAEAEAVKWTHSFADAALAWIDAGWTDPDLSFELDSLGETPGSAEAKLSTWGIDVAELRRDRRMLNATGLPNLFHLLEFDSKKEFEEYWQAETDAKARCQHPSDVDEHAMERENAQGECALALASHRSTRPGGDEPAASGGGG